MKNPFKSAFSEQPETTHMGLYAVRDRLLDYFLTPFAGPDDKNVLAAVSAQINDIRSNDAITQAPHQFEVWKIARITTDGHVTGEKVLLATCDALIRPGLRRDQQYREASGGSAAYGRTGTAEGPYGGPMPETRPAKEQVQGAPAQAGEPRPEPQGVHRDPEVNIYLGAAKTLVD